MQQMQPRMHPNGQSGLMQPQRFEPGLAPGQHIVAGSGAVYMGSQQMLPVAGQQYFAQPSPYQQPPPQQRPALARHGAMPIQTHGGDVLMGSQQMLPVAGQQYFAQPSPYQQPPSHWLPSHGALPPLQQRPALQARWRWPWESAAPQLARFPARVYDGIQQL
jgi:hypothetical protein